ncbi:hypothetical protein AURDEDRAFT_164548 [Auricularia subglabra TFB-10046 SS5]|nr:hypothetical protein AURDEDRAFT_164548 [Auricularia subglabra TFB-10046 SS5]
MDRLPDELAFMVLRYLDYNALRPVLATCTRWRALAEKNPVFWSDIVTPKSWEDSALEATPASARACRRISAMKGETCTLRLRGRLYPDILAAVVKHINHVGYLEARLDSDFDMAPFLDAMRTVSAPHLRKLTLQALADWGVLPPDLFNSNGCPSLTSVTLADFLLCEHDAPPCFSRVEHLQYTVTDTFFLEGCTDLFAYCPSLRHLCIGAEEMPDVSADHWETIRIFQIADYSQLQRLELVGKCWDLACQTNWPLSAIPHIRVNNPRCTFFDFLPHPLMSTAHIVLEAAGVDEYTITLGSDDWTVSRTCDIYCHNEAARLFEDGLPETSLLFDLRAPLPDMISTATLPALLWPISRRVLRGLSNVSELRLTVRNGGPLPNLGHSQRIPSPNLRTLVLRGEPDDGGAIVRVTYTEVLQFVRRELGSVSFPLHLRVENLELEGRPDDAFAASFSEVEALDPDSWRYLGYTWINANRERISLV